MTRRLLLAFMAALLMGVLSHQEAGAQDSIGVAASDRVNCILGGLAGAGSAGLILANPPTGLFNVVATSGVSLIAVQQIADACGSWWTVDLADRVHLLGAPPPNCVPVGPHHCIGGGGGGATW